MSVVNKGLGLPILSSSIYQYTSGMFIDQIVPSTNKISDFEVLNLIEQVSC